MVRLESKEFVLDNGVRFSSYGVPELETTPHLGEHFVNDVGNNLFLLLGFQGAGKTTVAREMTRMEKGVQVPVRVTRAIRNDELQYEEKTGLSEVILMSLGMFTQRADFLTVRFFNDSYYGIALEDVISVNNFRKRLGVKVKMLIAISGLWDVFRLRAIFPSMKVVYIAAPTNLRQERIDRQKRPAGQAVARQESELSRSEACQAVADFVIDNTSLSKERLFEIFSTYLAR